MRHDLFQRRFTETNDLSGKEFRFQVRFAQAKMCQVKVRAAIDTRTDWIGFSNQMAFLR
ncbi:hypothetical protein MKQ70_20925 [Chitinophaga sedimenti]|uniref:hypothetical protein n=1 Tax=Chitinophaga sedimenti TaxID=2033606 RepID=UPI002004D671|nr:hypothetical protein [Chitinophaga sedimenti]MCK7557331.1 hypothetical protein [Chitinophaga sedimenti]